jgi:hypothetical protein
MTALKRKAFPWMLALNVTLSLGVTLTQFTRAQDPGSTGAPQSGNPENKDGQSSSQPNNKDPKDSSQKNSDAGTDTSATSTPISVLGGATPLSGATGPLRWGDFFVRAVSFTELYDQVDYVGLTAPNKFSRNASLFQADLAFDHLTRHGHFALQYTPRVAVVEGQVYADYSNQNVALNLLYDLSPRWMMDVHDRVVYLSTQDVFSTFYVDANTQSGTTIQNNFLDGPGSLLNETAAVAFHYRWSPRTSISFEPSFSYLRTTGFQSPTLSSHVYSGAASLSYQLTPRSTLGVFFHTDQVELSGIEGRTQIYSSGLSYSRQIGEFWRVSGSFGALRNPASGTISPWTFDASGSLTRGFRRGSLGVVYNRDLAQGYVTNNYADRVDGFVSWGVTRVLQWRSSVGYQRESSVNNPITAKYTVNGFQLHLAPRVTLFADYTYRVQDGNVAQILSGHRNFLSGGIRWTAAPEMEPY